ncbi:MAG: hypothetical protein JWM70_441 [Microbacteriaceae bacterium]|nr:hypothetical protein [Microbacteriaceae bacterium]
MSTESSESPPSAVEAGEKLLAVLRKHVDLIAAHGIQDEAGEELDSQLWEAVGDYGDALDALDGDEEDEDEAAEPDELRFTVRTRYDYTVLDEKAFLASGKGLGEAVFSLLERAGGKPLSALEVASLETGSGLLTVHINNEPLAADDFRTADEPTDLLLIAPGETLAYTLDEPIYESRAEAEAAAKLRD